MIKAVKTSLILILLCGGVVQLRAQANPADAVEAAEAEAVRRQANTMTMRQVIDQARQARARGDTQLAITKYEQAWTLAQGLSDAGAERKEIQDELAPIRLEAAHKAEALDDYSAAQSHLKAALRVAPNDPAVQRAKRDIDQRIAEREGKKPSSEVTDRAEEFRTERIKTDTQVQNARFLIEMGRLDEAEKLLKQSTKSDPENRAAFYYLDLIKEQKYAQEARKREISSKDRLVAVEKSWNEPSLRELLPTPNPFATTNTVYTSPARQTLFRKMEVLKMDESSLPSDVELSEVLKDLNSYVRKRDVGGRGINFIISQSADRPQQFAQAGAIDPVTGLPQAAAAAPDIDVEKFKIKFEPPIRDVSIKQYLDAICMVAKPPEGAPSTARLKYTVEDYAIVFSQIQENPLETEPLYTRTFRLDPNTFQQGLEGVSFSPNPFQGLVVSAGGAGGGVGGGAGGAGGGLGGQTGQGGGPGGFFTFGGGAQQGGVGGGIGGGAGGQAQGISYVTTVTNTTQLQNTVRAFFTAAGVDFPTNQVGQAAFGGGGGQFGQPGGGTPPRKAMFFNDRKGVLFVRASLRDLEIIENALHALNIAPPQVSIEAKFAEFSQVDSKGLGFDWFLGNTLIGKGKMGVQGGTAPSFTGAPSAANPTGLFPDPAFAQSATDQNLTSGLRQSAPTIATFSGILTDPQFRVAIHAIENRQGVDLISAPSVTTISGRQARISVEETRTIIVGLTVQGLGGGGVGGGVAGGIGPTTP